MTRPAVPSRLDLTVAVLAALCGVTVVLVRDEGGAAVHGVPVELLAQVLASMALLLRSSFPGPVLLATTLLCWVSPAPAALVAAHSTGREVASTRASALWIAAAALLVGPVEAFTAPHVVPAATVAYVVAILVPWLIGRADRDTQRRAAEAAVRATRAQDRAAETARTAERERLTRETHDTVAHRISVIVLTANLLETSDPSPAVHEAAERIRHEGRLATDDLREVFGLERRYPPDDDPDDVLAVLSRLTQEARAVGQPIELDVQVSADELRGAAGSVVTLVVREALTNATAHSPGAATRVVVRSADRDRLQVVVRNDPPAHGVVRGPGQGAGLAGMADRVRSAGGTTTAAATGDGGFLVEAFLPRSPRALEPTSPEAT